MSTAQWIICKTDHVVFATCQNVVYVPRSVLFDLAQVLQSWKVAEMAKNAEMLKKA